MTSRITIGITDCSKYPNYEKWILAEPGVDVIRIGHPQNNFDEIRNCDGVVLTGGEDVNPKLYNRPEYLSYCHRDDMDDKRDALEWKVLEFTQQNQVPMLGICRGLQMGNVFFGGTLIPDLPSFDKPDHAKVDGVDRYHTVKLAANSLLSSIAGVDGAEVNSAHHQGVDRVGDGLVVNAISKDGVVEGLERINPKGKSFLMLVQWHPERMKDQDNVLTKNVKSAFIQAVRLTK